MALTISTGFVVDDAIVVTENVTRYIEAGDPPLEAALKGAKQIGFTIVSITVSLLAVFIPILLMGGIVGPPLPRVRGHAQRRHRRLGGGLADAHADDVRALLLKPEHAERARPLLPRLGARLRRACVARLRARARAGCSPPRAHAARSRWRPSALTVYLFVDRPQGPLPAAGHRAAHRASPRRRRTSRSRPCASGRRRSTRSCCADPAVRHVVSFIGGGGGIAATPARMFIELKPLAERKATRRRDHRPPAPQARAGAGHHAVPPGGAGRAHRRAHRRARSTSTRCRTPNLDELRTWAPRVLERAAQAARAARTSPAISRPAGLAARRSTIDRDTASRLGVTPQADRRHALRRLRPAPGRDHLHRSCNQYRVVLEVDARARSRAPTRSTQHLRPLARAARRCRSRRSPRFAPARRRRSPINHQGQFPAVTLSFNLAPGVALGPGGRRRSTRAEREIGLPASVHAELPGHRAGLPGVARQPADADPGRAARRLHRARRALREPASTRSRSSRRCPRRASGALLALLLFRHRASASSRSSASSCSSAS